jgi:hypothetical protein
MIRALPDRFSELIELSNICIDNISKFITLDNCIDILELAD